MKPETINTETTEPNKVNLDYFHSAAVVDSEGNEIPITEEMILKACEALESELN